jgi:hypothetical protein
MPFRDLLANLWSRNAILQCSHKQGSHYFVVAVYFDDFTNGAVFDPAQLVPFYGQIKLEIRPDAKAARRLHPLASHGLQIFPTLHSLWSLELMLGNKNGSKIQKMISLTDDESFHNSQKLLLELKDKGVNIDA